MAITLTRAGNTINLPVDILWTDQHSWSPVEQREDVSLTGALLIDVAVRTAGRHITLVADQNAGWIPYSDLLQLREWAAMPGAEMALSIDGAGYQVIFRHQEKPAVDVQEVVSYSLDDHADFFYGTLKFMEV